MDIYKSGNFDKEHEARMKFVRDLIWNDEKPNQKLLDIGCYRCFLASSLPKKWMQYYGIDFKNYARKKNVKVQNLNENTKLPYRDKSFDFIVAAGVLEHLFYPDELMKEIKRILKSSGIFIISLPNEKSLLARCQLLVGEDPPSIEEQETKHHWIFTPKVAREWVSKYFKIIEEKPYIGLWGRQYVPDFMVKELPNLFSSDYFFKCGKW